MFAQAWESLWTIGHFKGQKINFIAGPGTVIFTAVLILLGLLYWYKRRSTILFVGCAVLWMTFDLRMSAEMATYKDEFTFSQTAAHMTSFIGDDPQFVFMTNHPQGAEVIEYFAYPSKPIQASEDTPEINHVWVVFGPKEVEMNQDNVLQEGKGEVLSGPGEMLFYFSKGAFVFRETL